jgi:hypothetical protein
MYRQNNKPLFQIVVSSGVCCFNVSRRIFISCFLEQNVLPQIDNIDYIIMRVDLRQKFSPSIHKINMRLESLKQQISEIIISYDPVCFLHNLFL